MAYVVEFIMWPERGWFTSLHQAPQQTERSALQLQQIFEYRMGKPARVTRS